MGLGTGIFKRSLVILMSLAEKHLPKVTRVPSDQLHGMGVNLNDVHQLPRKRDKVTGISSTQGCPRSPKEGTQAAKMKPQAISHWLLPKFSFPGCKLTYFMILVHPADLPFNEVCRLLWTWSLLTQVADFIYTWKCAATSFSF